jgi:hypothetical protein
MGKTVHQGRRTIHPLLSAHPDFRREKNAWRRRSKQRVSGMMIKLDDINRIAGFINLHSIANRIFVKILTTH